MNQDTLTRLHVTLDRRERTEDILREVLALNIWNRQERQKLSTWQHQGNRWNPWAWSSMSGDFRRPVGMERQLNRAAELFPTLNAPLNQAGDPAGVQPYLHAIWASLGFTPEYPPDFMGRLNRLGRATAGIEFSNHAYNKRVRLALRLERKRQRLQAQLRQRVLTLASKSRLASQLTLEEFAREPFATAFMAYSTASNNRRSVFSAWGQQPARDEVVDFLLQRCQQTPDCNWYAVAHVSPTPEVLSHLSDAQKGELLGRTYALLSEAGTLLRDLWNRSTFQRDTMTVKRGDDSSTWNLLAGAWNQLRDQWINLLYALGAQAVLDVQCPGKVMRLIAADVVFMTMQYGKGKRDPNTLVWATLPLPWEVLEDRARCTRTQVEQVCQMADLDPVKSGWTGPRQQARTRPFTPTPELVHGVQVGHPGLALWLRKHGVFSGKKN